MFSSAQLCLLDGSLANEFELVEERHQQQIRGFHLHVCLLNSPCKPVVASSRLDLLAVEPMILGSGHAETELLFFLSFSLLLSFLSRSLSFSLSLYFLSLSLLLFRSLPFLIHSELKWRRVEWICAISEECVYEA